MIVNQNTPIPNDLLHAANEATTWGEYVKDIADDYEMNFQDAWGIFMMLGVDEAFDGFVTSMEDQFFI